MPTTRTSYRLFPYTTLFRSRPTRSEAHCPEEGITCITPTALAGGTAAGLKPDSCCAIASASAGSTPMRSEEHTSELQSRGQLVCRLLLEKKYCTSRTQSQNV